jgi:hypothetical protein
MGAVADEEIAVDFDPCVSQRGDFFQERNGIKDNAIADHAAATFAQHPARNELEHEFLAGNNDGVSGVVPAGVTGHHRKVLGEHVNDLAFAFVAPLGAYDDRRLAFVQPMLLMARNPKLRMMTWPLPPGFRTPSSSAEPQIGQNQGFTAAEVYLQS